MLRLDLGLTDGKSLKSANSIELIIPIGLLRIFQCKSASRMATEEGQFEGCSSFFSGLEEAPLRSLEQRR